MPGPVIVVQKKAQNGDNNAIVKRDSVGSVLAPLGSVNSCGIDRNGRFAAAAAVIESKKPKPASVVCSAASGHGSTVVVVNRNLAQKSSNASHNTSRKPFKPEEPSVAKNEQFTVSMDFDIPPEILEDLQGIVSNPGETVVSQKHDQNGVKKDIQPNQQKDVALEDEALLDWIDTVADDGFFHNGGGNGQNKEQVNTKTAVVQKDEGNPSTDFDNAVFAALDSLDLTQPPPFLVAEAKLEKKEVKSDAPKHECSSPIQPKRAAIVVGNHSSQQKPTVATKNNKTDVLFISAEEDAALDALLGYDGSQSIETSANPSVALRQNPEPMTSPHNTGRMDAELRVNRPSYIDLSLADENHFMIRLPSVRTELVKSYLDEFEPTTDSETGLPMLPLSTYNSFVLGLNAMNTLKVSPIPESVLRHFKPSGDKTRASLRENAQKLFEEKLPAKFRDALFPYQRDGVLFALEHCGRCMIGDEMGLGKTVQALGVAMCYREEWPILIVTPSSLKYQWAESVVQWLGVPESDVTVITSGKNVYLDAKCATIISYNIVPNIAPQLEKKQFGMIIADECHMLKCRSTKRTQKLRPIVKRCHRALFLSGTPALSRPSELYSQIEMLNGGLFPRFHEYGVRYCNGHQNQWRWCYDGVSNLRELHLVLQRAVMIRRLKANVLGEMPQKVRERVSIGIEKQHANTIQRVICDLHEASSTMRQVNSCASGSVGVNPAEYRSAHSKVKGILLELYRDSGSVKLPSVLVYIQDLLQSEVKFIVFAHHQDVMDGIAHSLQKSETDFIRIDGSVNAQARQTLVHHFQESPECRVALLSITAAGVGLTLTAASLVVFAELSWNPGILQQAEDRVHRIGQKNDVTVKYLVARGTVDEMMWKMLDTKVDVLSRTLDGKNGELFSATETTSNVDPDHCDNIDPFIQSILEVVDTYGERKCAAEAAAAAAAAGVPDEPLFTFEHSEDEIALAAAESKFGVNDEAENDEIDTQKGKRRGRPKGRKSGTWDSTSSNVLVDTPREIIVNLDDATSVEDMEQPFKRTNKAGAISKTKTASSSSTSSSSVADDIARLDCFRC